MSSKTMIILAALMLLLTIAPRPSSHNITWKRGPDIPLPSLDFHGTGKN